MKKAQVIWSAEALVDLQVIYDFLVGKSQSSAEGLIENILERTTQLENFPESGADQDFLSHRSKKYRYLVEGNHKIIYSFDSSSSTVFIEIVFDTQYDPEKLKL